MFATFKTLFKKINKNVKKPEVDSNFVEITREEVELMLTKLDETKEQSVSGDSRSVYSDNVDDALDALSIVETLADDGASLDRFDDGTKSEVGECKQKLVDGDLQKTVNKINSLQCPFTWNVRANNKRLILLIHNKYGEYNLDVSSAEFTFERFIGNLIIAYQLFHNEKHAELAQMKILELGKWLEELDAGTDEFYLSIKTGLKHVMSGTFIHMLFVTNLIGECKWLLDDVQPFASMDPKSRASVHAIHAAVLTEYGGNVLYYKKACECAKKACDLVPNTSHWFYIHSLALTAQRQFLHSIKSTPTEYEIDAIKKAIELSDGPNALYEYHKMTLDKDSVIYNYHTSTNKSDKLMKEKNLQENKRIVQTVNAILRMEPKDPHLVIKCAQTLMTLPFMVRDFKLGKQYLEKAFIMAPNDVSVLQAVKKAAKAYSETSKYNKNSSNESSQNQHEFKKKSSDLGAVLSVIVKKHKSGLNILPSLYSLLNDNKYNGNDKCKILAQLCSYTLLFKNDLRSSVGHFFALIEMPEITKNKFLIESHFSSFGSKKFNLADLICNEIRLAMNANGSSSGDVLYYNEMLTKIIKMCNLEIKNVDSSMKDKLVVDTSIKLSCSYKKYKKEIDSSDTESVNQSEHLTKRHKNKRKDLQKTGPRVFTAKTQTDKSELINKGNKKDNSSEKTGSINKNASNNSQSKSHQTNTRNIDELLSKISKFSPESDHGPRSLANSNHLTIEKRRTIQSQEAEINKYTQQLCQNILKLQCNSHNPVQNPLEQPLLSLRPQINVHDLTMSNSQKKKNNFSKKK